jgi:hypothetical protein
MGRIGVAISEKDAVFTERFDGYSPCTFPDAHGLVRYLALVLGSELAIWIALVTSGEFGVEREVIEKATLDRIPLPDFRTFSRSQKDEILALFEGLRTGKTSWDDVDEWVAALYGLGPRDLQVISDTLEFNLPFARNKQKAQDVPTTGERARFCEVLEKELTPWGDRFGSRIAVCPIHPPANSPWYGIEVRTSLHDAGVPVGARDWKGLLRAADSAAASEIVLHDGNEGLLIGRLAQRRYWSETQARLLAQRIAWSHVDLLKGQART